jgi:hypothetical protein
MRTTPMVPCDSDPVSFNTDSMLKDSEELAALRQTVTNCTCPCAEAGQALLRMVDELTMRAGDAQTILAAVSKERDELRAKLAEAEKNYADIAHAVGIEHVGDGFDPVPGPIDDVLRAIEHLNGANDRAGDYSARVFDLEEKLTDSERRFANESARADHHFKRADTAEAQVRDRDTLLRNENELYRQATERAEAAEKNYAIANQCIIWNTPYPREAELLAECRRQEERAERAEARAGELEDAACKRAGSSLENA